MFSDVDLLETRHGFFGGVLFMFCRDEMHGTVSFTDKKNRTTHETFFNFMPFIFANDSVIM